MKGKLENAEAQLVIAWLDEEIKVQEALSDRLLQMQNHIVSNDVAALERHLVESQGELDRLESLDRRRRKIHSAVLARHGVVAGPGSISRLVEMAPPERRVELGERVERLRGSSRRVRLLNNRNGMLARNLLELNEEFVRRLFQSPAGTQTYDPSGKTRVQPQRILDRSL